MSIFQEALESLEVIEKHVGEQSIRQRKPIRRAFETLSELLRQLSGARSKRCIDRPVFFGNGDASLYVTLALHARLEYAFSMVSGLQQGAALAGTPEFQDSLREINDVVREIALALDVEVEVEEPPLGNGEGRKQDDRDIKPENFMFETDDVGWVSVPGLPGVDVRVKNGKAQVRGFSKPFDPEAEYAKWEQGPECAWPSGVPVLFRDGFIRASHIAAIEVGRLAYEVDRLRADLADMQGTFDLRWSADMRAIRRWRAERPEERDLLSPDHADLVCWLADLLVKTEDHLDTILGRAEETLRNELGDEVVDKAWVFLEARHEQDKESDAEDA